MAHSLLIPGLVALGAGVLAVKKGWMKNPLDLIKPKPSAEQTLASVPGQGWFQSNVKSGQLGSADDLAQGQAAIMADLQRYQQYPGSAPGYRPYGYGFGYAQQAPWFGQGAYPMQNPYYGQQWFAQSGPAALPQGGMVAEWHTPGAP